MTNVVEMADYMPTEKRTPVLKKVAVALSILSTVAGSLTGIMTWANLGFSDAFLPSWGKSFMTAIIFLMPVAILLIGLFGKLVQKAMPNAHNLLKGFIVGVAASIVMQSIMAVITGYNTVGFDVLERFQSAWTNAFITAYPFGLAMALLMAIVIKPRLQAYIRS